MLAVEEQNVAAINDGEGEIDRNPEAEMEIDAAPATMLTSPPSLLPTNGNVRLFDRSSMTSQPTAIEQCKGMSRP